jgi:hypothetical protein
MYVSEPHFGLKLGKSSKRAKSCFLQRLKKKKKQSCGALISMAHVANMGGKKYMSARVRLCQ